MEDFFSFRTLIIRALMLRDRVVGGLNKKKKKNWCSRTESKCCNRNPEEGQVVRRESFQRSAGTLCKSPKEKRKHVGAETHRDTRQRKIVLLPKTTLEKDLFLQKRIHDTGKPHPPQRWIRRPSDETEELFVRAGFARHRILARTRRSY